MGEGFTYATFVQKLEEQNIPYDITEEVTDRMVRAKCEFCKVQALDANTKKPAPGNLLFMLDPKKGFMMHNIVTCCDLCMNLLEFNTQMMGKSDIDTWTKYINRILKMRKSLLTERADDANVKR